MQTSSPAAVTWARLAYRQQRWELILVTLGVAATAIAMLWFASQLPGLRAAAGPCLDPATYLPTCDAAAHRLSDTQALASRLLYLSWAAPFGMGVILGAPLVAREIDGATAQLAWTLSRSRTRWLLRRVAFVLLVTVGLLAVLGVTSEILAHALKPDRTLSQDFLWVGRRGWMIVARGTGALLVGVLAGALAGRVLPALLLAAIGVALVFTAISLVQDRVLRIEAQVLRAYDGNSTTSADEGALLINYGLETPDGRVYTFGEAYDQGLVTAVIDEQGRNFASTADMLAGRVLGYDIALVIPGSQYTAVTAREGAASVGIGLVALFASAFVVRRRRPT
jgi:hypothetical protein